MDYDELNMGAFIWVPELEDEGKDSVFQCNPRDWEKDYLDLSPERPLRRASVKFLENGEGHDFYSKG